MKGSERAAGGPQEAVSSEACVKIESCDRSRRVDVIGYGEYGAQRIECGECPVAGCPQEAASYAHCVSVESRDCSRRIDGDRFGATGAREIELDNGGGFRRSLRAGGCLLAIQLQATNQKDYAD